MEVPNYRRLLSELAQNLTASDLTAIKFRCIDLIPRRKLEAITDGYGLWMALEERKLVSSTDLIFMKELLSTCTDGRRDLLDIVQKYESCNAYSAGHGQSDFSHVQQDLKKECRIISQNLGRYWKEFARELNLSQQDIDHIVEANDRNLKEQIKHCLRLWAEKADNKATKMELVKALEAIELNLLAEKVKECT